MPDATDIQQLDISFETLSVPPPYSHVYTFRLKFDQEQLSVAYDLQYTDREELSEEEIWEEGFTINDDFHWKGNLPEVWCEALAQLWTKTHWNSTEEMSEAAENAVLITTTFTNGSQQQGVPSSLDGWEYLLQELTQAVYEAAQRERPLRIRYLERSSRGEEHQLTLTVRFRERKLEVVRQKDRQTQRSNPPWTEVKPLLTTLYQLDYDGEQARTKMPNHPGKFLDPGDNHWYALGQQVTNPGQRNHLAQLKDHISVLIKR